MAERYADERAGAAARPVRAPAEPSVAAGARFVSLQRAAGNRAVAGLLRTRGAAAEQGLAGRTTAREPDGGGVRGCEPLHGRGSGVPVQRDVGFELESGEWRARVLNRPPTAAEQASGDVAHGAAPTGLPAGRSAFLAEPGFRGTADEIPEGRDVEFVVDHVPEDRPDLVRTAFDGLAAALARMEWMERAQAKRRSYLWPERQLGWVPPAAGTWLLQNTRRAEPTRFVLQATAGLRLDRMHGLMANLGENYFGLAPADDPTAQTSVAAGAGIELRDAAFMAEKSWRDHLVATPAPVGIFDDSGALLGFLGQLAVLLVGGTRAPAEREDAVVSYPKALAHLMARTDFAALFRLLPVPQQGALRAGRLLDVVERIAGRTDVPGLDQRVLQHNVWRQIERTQILLTRRAWVDGILAGQDRLTESGYRAWLDEQVGRPRGMHAAVYERALAGARQLDALGSRGAAVDRRGGHDLPLFEFRSITGGDEGYRSMTLPEARDRALRLAAYVDRVNRGVAPLPTT